MVPENPENNRIQAFNWRLWRRFAGHLGPERGDIRYLIAASLLLAAVDTAFPFVTGILIDEALSAGLTARARWLAGGYALLAVLLCLSLWVMVRFAGSVATGLAHRLRRSSFDKLQQLSFAYYDRHAVGWLVSRLTSDCAKVSDIAPWVLVDFTWGPALLLGTFAAMLWQNVHLTLVVCLVVPPMALASIYFKRRMLISSRALRHSNAQMTAAFNEAIMGVRTTKLLVREADNLEEFSALSQTAHGHAMRNTLESAVYLPLIILLGNIGVGLALWRGGVELHDGLTYGTLVAFMQYAALFSMPVQDMAKQFTGLQSAQAAAERVQSLLDEIPDIDDSPRVAAALRTHQSDRARDVHIAPDGHARRIQRLQFRDVDFEYVPGEPVLRGFNLDVRAGQSIALVGATGGGKSTIVNLAARFYEVTRGAIEVDGIDIRERGLHWYQSQFGIVLQSPQLFRGSVRDNIRYGRLEANDDEIEAAARLARAHDFIEQLDDGYAFDVGEGGRRLSTGQRQLLALARAILADPQIFILDEATSSIDTETEAAIQTGIEAALRGRISLIIAHRLSTIRNADRIVVIEGGEIVESGSHAELLARQGHYARLHREQLVPGTSE